MPDEKKLDPFSPLQPHIPGVPASQRQAAPAGGPAPSNSSIPGQDEAKARGLWVSLVVASVLIIIIAAFLVSRLSLRGSDQSNASTTSATNPSLDALSPPSPADNLPVGPGVVATADELAKTWSSKRFQFRDPATGEAAPAMVVRLPGGDYWGFSLREPFGNCTLEYVTDPQALQTKYNFQADHPMVVDPCNQSVFDLLRYGSTPSGALVRGEIEQGVAIRPPVAIEIRKEGNEIRAVRME